MILPETISMSRVNTFIDCYKKYELSYIKGIKLPETAHTWLGSRVHSDLEKFINGEAADTDIIVSEHKEYLDSFNIPNYEEYFRFISLNLLDMLNELGDFTIVGTEMELSVNDLHLEGIVDLILYTPEDYTLHILDYKVSKNDKTLDTIEQDAQLYLYTLLTESIGNKLKDLDIRNIKVGYINIPKYILCKPNLLKSGKLSKDKSQKTTVELYIEAIEENGLNITEYQDFIDTLGTTKDHVNIKEMKLDIGEMLRVAEEHKMYYNLIQYHTANEIFPRAYSDYKCSKCDYYKYCKGASFNG